MTTEIPARPDGVLYGRGAANIAALDHEHAVARVAVEALRQIQEHNDSDCRYCGASAWKHHEGCPIEALAKIEASGWWP
jgi:hypothetical protein